MKKRGFVNYKNYVNIRLLRNICLKEYGYIYKCVHEYCIYMHVCIFVCVHVYTYTCIFMCFEHVLSFVCFCVYIYISA